MTYLYCTRDYEATFASALKSASTHVHNYNTPALQRARQSTGAYAAARPSNSPSPLAYRTRSSYHAMPAT